MEWVFKRGRCITFKIYSTKEVADLTGVHPNTVRLYEEWGYISKVKRGNNNYRQFTKIHIYQMKLARVALPGPYPMDGALVHELVKRFAAGDSETALELAREYSSQVDSEKEKALDAINVLKKWFENDTGSKDKIVYLTRKSAAKNLNITTETLRTWERNALFKIKRGNNRRLLFTEWDIEKIKVIRLLRNCGYSIASLFNVFHNYDQNIKVSELLNLSKDNNEIFYDTDRYLEFLAEHKNRAEKIINLIKK